MNYAKRIEFLTGSAARTILSNCQSRTITSFAGGLPGKEAFADLQLPDVDVRYLQYGPSEGERVLREQWVAQLESLGIPCESKQIIVTSGSQQGLDLVSKLWIDPGATVAVESPTYMAAIQVFSLFQADICSVPSGPEGAVDLPRLECVLRTKKPRFLYLNPTFQNPSGYCYNENERRQVAELLDKYADQTVLIEDDPYRSLYYEDAAPAQPVASHLRRAKWVYLGTTSKVLIPGLRIGFLAASEEFIDSFLKLKQAADLHSNRLAQSMVVHFLSNENWMANRLSVLRSSYQRRRDLMQNVLLRCASAQCDWELPKGGMFFWLRLKHIDLQRVLGDAIEHGVAFLPGDSFFVGNQEQGRYIRLNFTGVGEREIEEQLPVVFSLLESLGN